MTAEKIRCVRCSGNLATLLEYISTILADNLRARVEYHANGHYDLGDLWPAVVRAWKERLQEAKESAISWQKGVTEIEKCRRRRIKMSRTRSPKTG